MRNLKDMIDVPLQKSIALINLLGVKTYWSCCGYDYLGQEEGKGHMYGAVQITFEPSPKADALLLSVIKTLGVWKGCSTRVAPGVLALALEYPIQGLHPSWKGEKNPHIAEGAVAAINILEMDLLAKEKHMEEKVIISDMNKFSLEKNRHWNFLPSKDWEVLKKDWI